MNMVYFDIGIQSSVALVAWHFASLVTSIFYLKHRLNFHLILAMMAMVNMDNEIGMRCSVFRGKGRMIWIK